MAVSFYTLIWDLYSIDTIFRSFKTVKIGDILTVIIGKMYVDVKKPTLVLTDLYVKSVNCLCSFRFHLYDTYLSNGLFKVGILSFEAFGLL